jgi:uncharacterized protein
MDSIKLIDKYYDRLPVAKEYLLAHSMAVAKKSLNIAQKFESVDIDFIEQAAMLHDIGIFLTYAPHIGCKGREPYICHGILGREILKKEGLSKHGLVAERHIGVGLTERDIKEQDLPLPVKDMTPQTKEEEIIAYADLFFSKSHKPINKEKPIKQIKNGLAKFGTSKIKIFDQWVKKYSL